MPFRMVVMVFLLVWLFEEIEWCTEQLDVNEKGYVRLNSVRIVQVMLG
jgi:hypothetical protein